MIGGNDVYNSILILLILSVIQVASADSATQTDWSGGYGEPGPVVQWDDSYDTSTELSWYRVDGGLVLQYDLEVEQIASSITGEFRMLHSFDLENDGDLDILVTLDSTCVVFILLNEVNGWTKEMVLSIPDTHASAYAARAGDIDGDGDYDVVANYDSDWYTQHFSIFLNTTEGWVEDSLCDFSEADLWLEDIDSDGDCDIAGRLKIGGLGWWENLDGQGTSWDQHNLLYFGTTWSIRAADYDLDGDIDLLVLKDYGYNVYLLQQQPDGGFITLDIAGMVNNPNCAEFADMDGDSDLDVVVSCWYSQGIFWCEQITPDTWMPHTILPDTVWDYPYRLGCADLDLDGDMDVYGTMSNSHVIAWLENVDGDAQSWLRHDMTWCAYGRGLCSGDFNNDGRPDFAVGCPITDDVRLYSLTGLEDQGTLTSSILDTETYPNWDFLTWNSETPAGTSVSFQVRSSNDYLNMGTWSDTLWNPCSLEGILTDGDRYIQYRVILSTANPDTAPIFNDVTISWNLLGIGETAELITPETGLLPISPNPVTGSPIIRFGLFESASVELIVFDLLGRLVSEIHGDDYSPGFHEVLLGALSPGIYFCKMISEDFIATQRFVVIK